MDYAGLQTAINSTFGGRTDIPEHIYEIALSEINRDVRTLDMQGTTTLTASTEEVSLPSDFLEVVAAYIDSGGYRNRLEPRTPDALNYRRDDTGRPGFYAVVDGALKLLPAPDGSYDIELRYYQRNSALSADGDTNDVLSQYPELYLYCVAKHAATWMQDAELITAFAGTYMDAYERMKKSERSRMLAGPVTRRPFYDVTRTK